MGRPRPCVEAWGSTASCAQVPGRLGAGGAGRGRASAMPPSLEPGLGTGALPSRPSFCRAGAWDREVTWALSHQLAVDPGKSRHPDLKASFS